MWGGETPLLATDTAGRMDWPVATMPCPCWGTLVPAVPGEVAAVPSVWGPQPCQCLLEKPLAGL